MMKQTRCYGCDKPIEPEWLPVGEFIVCDECSSTADELSVEKLQEQLNTAKKALTEIYNQPEDDGTISIDEYPSQIRYYARTALAEIGNEGSGDE
ncbi:hypothetical protein [Lactococcus lactis]|uniref:hypothetical protein n=1 Tax=Lactococcus lactis TaxID=1358 RepID=UPI00177EECC5|nr:hypothetical protein [Lactococcus lactis]MBD5854878.1 hypothetical protein [Lactococcus lactis]